MNQVSGERAGQAPTQLRPAVDSSDLRAQPIPVHIETRLFNTVDAVIQKLSAYLTEPQMGTAGYRFDDATSLLGPSDPISYAFQTRGFWAWLAYFLATKDLEYFNALSQTLSNFSPATLSHVAAHVSQVKAQTSLTRMMEQMLWVSRRGPTRRSQLEEAGILDFPPEPQPPTTPSSHSDPKTPKRRRVQLANLPDTPTEATAQSSSYNIDLGTTQTDVTSPTCYLTAGQPTEGLHKHNNTSRLMFNIDPRYNYSYPNATNVPLVFEPDLGDMIVRNGYNASILASLPPDPTQCQLVLDVEAPAVVPLAMKLYGAQIVEVEQQRAFHLPSGASVAIMDTVKLTKTKVRLWEELLGNLVIAGVRNSQEHINEVMQGMVLSKCLSMEIPGAADRPARISLAMDAFILGDIINKLWLS